VLAAGGSERGEHQAGNQGRELPDVGGVRGSRGRREEQQGRSAYEIMFYDTEVPATTLKKKRSSG
jgi:hypothetical protein